MPVKGWRILASRKPPREQMLRGGAMLGATLLFFTTLRYLPQAEATAINFLAPLIVLLLAPWVLREPPRLSRWIAAGVAISLGVLVVIRPGGGLDPVGTMFGLAGAFCFSAQYIASRRVAADDPLTSVIWSGGVGTVVLSFALPYVMPTALPVLRELDACCTGACWYPRASPAASATCCRSRRIAKPRHRRWRPSPTCRSSAPRPRAGWSGGTPPPPFFSPTR